MQFCSKISFQKTMVNMGIKLHNKLPDSIKKLGNFKLLKKRIKILTIEPFTLFS